MKASLIVAALVAALGPISVIAAPGDLYVSDGSVIYKFAQDGTRSTFASSGLVGSKGLAFDGSGNLFVADSGTSKIIKIAPDGTQSTFAPGLNGPTGLVFDRAGSLFVANRNSGTIQKFAPDGTNTTFASDLHQPQGLAFDSSGNLFVADSGSGAILKITPAETKSTFTSGLSIPYGLAFDSAGNLLVADLGANTIFKFTPDGTRTTFASSLNQPDGLAFDSAGNLFEVDNGTDTIFIFTPAKFPFATGLANPSGLAFEPTRHQFLNVSTRALVGTGDNALIGGFIMNGNGKVDEAVVVRAIGPSLTAFGVPGALQDPLLELRGADGSLLATNDNWKTRSDGSSQQALITSTGLAPSDDRESAIYARLPAGHYTTIVRGASSTTGVAIVEVYNLQ